MKKLTRIKLGSLIGTIGHNVQDASGSAKLFRLKVQLKLLKRVTDLIEQKHAKKIGVKAFEDQLNEMSEAVIIRVHAPLGPNEIDLWDHYDLISIAHNVNQILCFVFGKKACEFFSECDEMISMADELVSMVDAKGDFCIDVEEAKTVQKFTDQLKETHQKLIGCLGVLTSFSEVN